MAVAALYFKFPSFIKKKQLEEHITRHGFSSNIVDIDMHVHLPSKKPSGSAKVLITPSTHQEKFISVLDQTCIQDQYRLSVQVYTPKTKYSNAMQKPYQPHLQRKANQKESFVVFVGSRLPHYINKGDILSHFSELKDTITNIEFKHERKGKTCYVLITLRSSNSAMKAIEKYNRTFLLGKHKIKVDMYNPQNPLSSSTSCPAMHITRSQRADLAADSQSLEHENLHEPVGASESYPVQLNTKFMTKGSDKMPQTSSLDHTEKLEEYGWDDMQRSPGVEPNFSTTLEFSSVPQGIREIATPASQPSMLDHCDGEDQMQNTMTTVIVENLHPNTSQSDIEALTGVTVDGYTPSHMTPDKVAAWIEVANSKLACAVADRLDGKVIHGRKLSCFLTETISLRQQVYHNSSLSCPYEEQVDLSTPDIVDPTILGTATQAGHAPLFFLGDTTYPSQESQTLPSFSHDPAVMYFVPPFTPSMQVYDPQPPLSFPPM